MKKHLITIMLTVMITFLLPAMEITDFGYTEWSSYTQREKEMFVFGYLNAVLAINSYITEHYYNHEIDISIYMHRGETVTQIIKYVDLLYLFNKDIPLYQIITMWLHTT